MVQQLEDVIFDDDDAFLKRYVNVSASKGTFELGLNLPKCRATANLKISSTVTPVSITASTFSRLLLILGHPAPTVSLFLPGSFSRSWYLVGHSVTNVLRGLARKIIRCLIRSDDRVHGRRNIRLRHVD
jgi:hypothetical protein